MAFPPFVISADSSPVSSTPGGAAGLAVIALTTLTGLVVAITGLVRVFFPEGRRKGKDPAPAPVQVADVDAPDFEERAWLDLIEQLEAANERADRADERTERAEAEARDWRDRYVRLLEEGRVHDP